MPDSLPVLEMQRAAIQQQITQLGDLRAGSITTTGGRCGNPRCHCHQKDDPGHGPFYRLTRKVNGKTVTETFAIPAALRKAQIEIAEYHRFRELSRDLLEINEKICRARPVADTLTPEEKNGRGDPERDRARSSRATGSHLRRAQADRQDGSGGGRTGLSRWPASCRRRRPRAIAALQRASRTTTRPCVFLRSPGAVPRTALAACVNRSGCGGSHAAMVSVSALPPRPIPGRP